jgi:2',3'-cyclic-nucleotide 2'-phosphodiesterase (5'-nucleotidase family)
MKGRLARAEFMDRPVTRRGVVAGLPGVAMGLSLARALPARAREADALLFLLADLHSPYRRLPQLLRAIREMIAQANGRPAMVMINGDLFERGNVAARRSGAALDWAFLGALAEIAPTVVNIGNHETAIVDDLAEFVVAAQGLGALPVGNIRDRRTGGFFAPPSLALRLGALTVGVLGVAPVNPLLYRREARASMAIPEPVAYARDAMAAAFAGVDQAVLISHAGVDPDRAILAGMPPGALLFGGHDHLTLNLSRRGVGYAHAGSWGSTIGVAALRRGAKPEVTLVPVGDDAPDDDALAAVEHRLLGVHLLDEDREVIATLPRSMGFAEGALFAGEALRRAAGADIGMLGHTGFGATLSAGPLSRFAFDAWFRFDGDALVAEMDGADLAAALDRANQHEAPVLEARTGDFLYADGISPEPGRRYRVAVADWTAQHQREYFGAEGFDFAYVPGLRLKPMLEAALRAL